MDITMFSFQEIKPTDEDWMLIESSSDCTCYQTRKYTDFILSTGHKVFVAKVFMNNKVMGYFIGEKVWRGLMMIAAPLEGLNTNSQGLIMMQLVSAKTRLTIYNELSQWLFDSHIASYLQVEDWQLRKESSHWINANEVDYDFINDYDGAPIEFETRPTLYLSMNKSISDLWSGLYYKSCKYCVNKAKKMGLQTRIIDKYEDIDGFVDVHYRQLFEVCQRKGAIPRPSQSKARMAALCKALFPDKVIMIEIVGNDEKGEQQIMSSGIFCIGKGECCYWTGASFRKYQSYCPNELMVWEAIRIMSEYGDGDLNFVGTAHYKLKFGTVYGYVPRIVFSKYKWVFKGKTKLKKMFKTAYGMLGMMVSKLAN